jgi:hypothetical protein
MAGSWPGEIPQFDNDEDRPIEFHTWLYISV